MIIDSALLIGNMLLRRYESLIEYVFEFPGIALRRVAATSNKLPPATSRSNSIVQSCQVKGLERDRDDEPHVRYLSFSHENTL